MNSETLGAMRTNQGETVLEISEKFPVLLIFLRHFGCIFCKEALDDIAGIRDRIEQKGVRIVFVHMSANSVAKRYFEEYNMTDATHVSDPEQVYYAKFNLTKGNFSQLYGLQTWIRGFSMQKAGYRLELARALGDSTQMPGIFLIHQGEIKNSFIHRRVSDRPDYDALVEFDISPIS